MRLLVLTDDQSLLANLHLTLQEHIIETEYEADAGASLALRNDYDAIILGDQVADQSAPAMLRQLRRAAVTTPTLCLMPGPKSIPQLLECFNAGADDWMSVPFHRHELLVRIEGLARRARGLGSPVVAIGALEIDLYAKVARTDGRTVPLTAKEWRLLEALVLARNRGTMHQARLLDALYDGAEDQPEIKIIDVFVCKIRKKLREAGLTGYIETVWGRGYQLVDPTV